MQQRTDCQNNTRRLGVKEMKRKIRKRQIGLNRLRETQKDWKRGRWGGRMAERALLQRGEKNPARSRHQANGPTTVNIMAVWYTHTHTHGWPTALPAALSVTVWLVVLSSPSPANHGAICYPTTWPPTRQAHTNTHRHTQNASYLALPRCCHTETHTSNFTDTGVAQRYQHIAFPQRPAHKLISLHAHKQVNAHHFEHVHKHAVAADRLHVRVCVMTVVRQC